MKDSTYHIHGKIIFWSNTKVFGFIEKPSKETIFFHKKDLCSNYKPQQVKLFDVVTFKEGLTKTGRFAGKPFAYDVCLKEKKENPYVDYQRLVGKLTDWNGRKGFIESPNLEKKVRLFVTRLVEVNDKRFNNGDVFIFNRVLSSKGDGKLFAFFAYPLYKEKDLLFLKEKYRESNLEEVKEQIISLNNSNVVKSDEDSFEWEIGLIGKVDGYDKFLELKKLLLKYNKNGNCITNWNTLKDFEVPYKYLIQLWESNLIRSYDLEFMLEYFYHAKASDKRAMVERFNEKDRDSILNYYHKQLLNSGRFKRLNNDLKTFLDIVFRIPGDSNNALYKSAKTYLIETLEPTELIDLWVHGYLELEERFVVEHFDISKMKWIDSLMSDEEKSEVVEKIFEEYALKFRNQNFENKLEDLISYLLIFQDKFETRFNEIKKGISANLNKDQKFTLWIFGVKIDFDGHAYILENHSKVNHYFKLKYFIREDITSLPTEIEINQNGLIEFVKDYLWNDVLSPTEILGSKSQSFLLPDVETFIEKFAIEEIDLSKISLVIFEHLPKYTIHHLRLWLNEYVDDSLFSYVGFRKEFDNLKPFEQKKFKQKGKWELNEELVIKETNAIIPCEKFEEFSNEMKRYEAIAENIYFSSGGFMLRMETGDFTKTKNEPFADTGWNRIPASSIFNKITISLTVSKNDEILDSNPLQEFITLIHTNSIEKALGKIGNPIPETERKPKRTYIEDWKLKEEVLIFLEENQSTAVEPAEPFGEPKNYFRRLDEESEVDNYETVCLFTIDLGDGYGIIWENLDYTEDRATYIFKTKYENHSIQISKIKKHITSTAQLRSALISKNKDSQLQIFKDNLGYVASIKKRRGKNESFSRWQQNFEKYSRRVIPELPTVKEIESLQNWSPDISHSLIDRKSKVKIFDDDKVDVSTLFGGNDAQPKNENKTNSKSSKYRILKALQDFNK